MADTVSTSRLEAENKLLRSALESLAALRVVDMPTRVYAEMTIKAADAIRCGRKTIDGESN